ncbi:MAG: methyltransferase domain-containing protein [Ardenticatenales bacterium]|nr:methyltransferase domain-containing protein [Ardenticatenales bacterium]
MGKISRFIYGTLFALLTALVYWFMMVSQGVYFGRRMVLWLYDRGASVYDLIKRNNPVEEAAFLGIPIAERLARDIGPRPLLLDVAVGTARLPLALFARPSYQGNIVGVDISRQMLAEAASKVAPYKERITLLHFPSLPLPFADESFDAVTCIEAIEFMPDWKGAIAEMVRVLRPGGWLAVTNRIGPTAKLMPGQVEAAPRFVAFLQSLGLLHVAPHDLKKRYFGQLYYELILGQKNGTRALSQPSDESWLSALKCPHCDEEGRGVLEAGGRQWRCKGCVGTIRIEDDGVWALLEESSLSL